MKITDEIVDHIAHLARLKFEGDKKIAIKQDLEKTDKKYFTNQKYKKQAEITC